MGRFILYWRLEKNKKNNKTDNKKMKFNEANVDYSNGLEQKATSLFEAIKHYEAEKIELFRKASKERILVHALKIYSNALTASQVKTFVEKDCVPSYFHHMKANKALREYIMPAKEKGACYKSLNKLF